MRMEFDVLMKQFKVNILRLLWERLSKQREISAVLQAVPKKPSRWRAFERL